MRSSGVCIPEPSAHPMQTAGMPSAAAALASVDPAANASPSPIDRRACITVSTSGSPASTRPAPRRPTTSTFRRRGAVTASPPTRSSKRRSAASSSERSSTTISASAAIALMASPPEMRPMLTGPSSMSSAASPISSCTALGVPRSDQE